MRNYIFTFIIVFSAWFMTGCQPTLIAEFEDKPVVKCYLDAGESPTLNISKLIAFRDDAVYSSQDINSLIISVTDKTTNTSYILENVEDGNYTNSALIAEVGHTYTLNFAYNNLPITATTIVPEGPTDVEYSDNSIGIMTPKTRMGMGIEITWSNDEGNYYIVEGSTTSVQPINYSYDEDEWPEKSFKLDYTQGNSATLNSSQFQYYGKYEISLIRIQSEYVIMSQGSSNTSTSLVDIRGNIDGGYGIFTGINREKKQITIYKESSPF